jgi:N-acetylglutamate synthase-like GNAT family acetyltransferase
LPCVLAAIACQKAKFRATFEFVESTGSPTRRATPQDLAALQTLWEQAGLPAAGLSEFAGEFQVYEAPDGGFLAAIGLLVEGQHALLHSEAIVAGADADELRLALWTRIQIIARNQGLKWVWTQEDAEYWRNSGFEAPAGVGSASDLPSFVDQSPGWRRFQLFDPNAARTVIDEQLAIWQATRAQEAEMLQNRIRSLRNLALLAASAVILGTVGILLYVVLRRPELVQKLMHGR